MSSGKFPDPREIYAFRRGFMDLWMGYRRANYTSTVHVALCFSVDESTARSWWNGITAPSGFAVAIAFRNDPVNATRFLIGGCGGWLTTPLRWKGACR